MNEIWKDIVGYEGSYQISDFGRITSYDRISIDGRRLKGCIKKLSIHHTGYLHASLYSKLFLVHRLVAEAFIPNPENKPDINHINGCKIDNRVINLEWTDDFMNQQHSYKTVLFHANAKLTPNDVENIRALLNSGYPQMKIAAMFSVDPTTISKINTGKIWFYV